MRRPFRLVALGLTAAGLLLPLAVGQASRAQACNVRVVLETPEEGATVEPQQTISGWAVDLAATSGTGIDAVVASLDGALDSPDNRLIGVAEYGSERPEVAETLGEERFAASGFTFTWDTANAPPGPRRLFVQAHSACGWHTVSRPIVVGGTASAAPTPVAPATAPAAPVAVVTPTPASAAARPAATGTVAPAGTAAPGAAGALVITPGLLTPLPTSTALLPPENLRLIATTSNSVTLTWDPPRGQPPAGYIIHQSHVLPSGGNAPPIIVARVPGTVTSVTLSGLQDPTRYTYYFTVSAVSAAGVASPYVLTSVSTTPLNTRVALPPTPPGGPAVAAAATPSVPAAAAGGAFFVASATAAGGTSVTVTWPQQPGATAYNVYGAAALAGVPSGQPAAGGAASPLANAAPGTWVAVANAVQGTSATVAGLVPGGIYDFLVRAVNAAGQEISQSAPSRVSLPSGAAVGPPPTAPPAAVSGTPPGAAPGTGFTLTVTSPSNTSLVLTWTPQPGATSYALYVSRPGGQLVADPNRAALTGTTTQIDGLTPGSQFVFQLAARDAQGQEIARSNQVQATVGAAGPGAPGPLGMGPFPQVTTPTPSTATGAAAPGTTFQLQANPSDPGTANLQWAQVPGAASYAVWGAPAGGQTQVVVPSTQNAAAYIPNLPAGQWTFQVQARDASGNPIAQSNPVAVTVTPR